MKPRVAWTSLVLIAAGCSNTPTPSPSGGPELGNAASAATGVGSRRQHQQAVERTDIVSDRSGARVLDPDLVNAWGLAFSPRGFAWVSANETGLSEVYDEQGNHVISPVTVPVPEGATPPSAPTGQVFNSNTSAFDGDLFIFVTEDGTISGWQPTGGSTAMLRVDNSGSGAIYKGVTIAETDGSQPRLYAANFHGGTVDIFDSTYAPVTPSGGFADPDMTAGYAPFNVENIGGNLAVTYALQDADAEDDTAGPGNGFVDLFDQDGMLITRLISHGALNSPWGLTLTPSHFGSIPHRLLVGNFGDGAINVYLLTGSGSRTRAMHEGTLIDETGSPVVIDGLWALRFGPGPGGFETDDLYFTAGPGHESHGVFGELAIPGH